MENSIGAASQETINLKGEVPQLRDELDSNDPSLRKKAAKRVVQIMRAGENVGELFSSMLRCIKTDDIELKRLVYLYLVTYSLQESEQSIMIVNTIIQDSQDPNPLIRALALRTMSRIHIEGVAENMIIPLKQRIEDSDAYVRKTAALCVAKLYDIIPEAMDNANIYQSLTNLLCDSNPLVISNACASIMEINSKRPTPIFTFNSNNISSIVNAITSSSEWCQTVLFDVLSQYTPANAEEANIMIQRILPFLKQDNAAVVIGAFKSIFQLMKYDPSINQQQLFGDIMPPFLSLASADDFEIQYIVLRTLNLFLMKYPSSLQKEIRVFFCKYNDPSYIKMQKLDIITSNCTTRNAQIVLDELTEYCNEVDVEFVRKTIKCIGTIALRLPSCARRCVDILVALVEGKAEYSTEQSVIVLADILRKFPGQFESVISKVCNNIEQLKDSNARAALIWILGEYNSMIEKVDIIIDPFLDNFSEESPQVQLQLISTIVKVFLDNPDLAQDQLQFVLSEATKETILPDVRNRALVYWRMLSIDKNLAREFVIFPKAQVDYTDITYSDDILDKLIENIGMVSGVMHILPNKLKSKVIMSYEEEKEDTFRIWKPAQVRDPQNCPVSVMTDWDEANYFIQITNKSDRTLSNLAIALNVNALGLELVEPIVFPESIGPVDQCEVSIRYVCNPTKVSIKTDSNNEIDFNLDFALRLGTEAYFYKDFFDFRRATLPPKKIQIADILKNYTKPEEEINFKIDGGIIAPASDLLDRNVSCLLKVESKLYFGFTLPPDYDYLAELVPVEGGTQCKIKGNPFFLNYIKQYAKYVFCTD